MTEYRELTYRRQRWGSPRCWGYTVAGLVWTLLATSTVVGCGESAKAPAAHPKGRTDSSPTDIGLPARAAPAGVRICGFLSEGSYTASQVEIRRLTCPLAAETVRQYLRAGAPGVPAWHVDRSCHSSAGAPRGTDAGCNVQLVERHTSPPRALRFLEGGHRGRPAPRPVLRLQPGDDRDLTALGKGG